MWNRFATRSPVGWKGGGGTFSACRQWSIDSQRTPFAGSVELLERLFGLRSFRAFRVRVIVLVLKVRRFRDALGV